MCAVKAEGSGMVVCEVVGVKEQMPTALTGGRGEGHQRDHARDPMQFVIDTTI